MVKGDKGNIFFIQQVYSTLNKKIFFNNFTQQCIRKLTYFDLSLSLGFVFDTLPMAGLYSSISSYNI